jgi:hypothetical protein
LIKVMGTNLEPKIHTWVQTSPLKLE